MRWYPTSQLSYSLCHRTKAMELCLTGAGICSQGVLCLQTTTILLSNLFSTLSTPHHRHTELTLSNSHFVYSWKGYSTNKVNEEKKQLFPHCFTFGSAPPDHMAPAFIFSQHKLELSGQFKKFRWNTIFCLKNTNKQSYTIWDFKQIELPNQGAPCKHRGACIPQVCKYLHHSLAVLLFFCSPNSWAWREARECQTWVGRGTGWGKIVRFNSCISKEQHSMETLNWVRLHDTAVFLRCSCLSLEPEWLSIIALGSLLFIHSNAIDWSKQLVSHPHLHTT